MENTTIAVHVESLRKQNKGKLILDGVNFSTPAGSITGIVGANGSGKTTLMRIITTLVKQTSGKVTCLGEEIGKSGEYLKKVGTLIEIPTFYPELTALQNLKIRAAYAGVKAPKLLECLDLVNLLAVKDQAVNKFSLGMKQRLGIAATFLNDPQLVILDEPTNGLDAQSVSAFNNLVRAKNQNGVTFLISSHLLSDLEPLSDRILMMSEGKVEYSGSTKELLKSQKETIVIKPKYRADLSRLSIIFKEAGINYLLHENSLEIPLAEKNQGWGFPQISNLTLKSCVELDSIYAKKATLEDRYLELQNRKATV